MFEWLWYWYRVIVDLILDLLFGPSDAVRRTLRDLEAAQASLQSAQQNLARVIGKLKAVKAQPNPDPRELGQLEGDAAAFGRQMDAAKRRIKFLQDRLDRLDPDGSLRASLR